MFAVPGWSVAADSLKKESITDEQSSATKANKKRKRANAQQDNSTVDSSTVGDLWSSVVEGRAAPADASQKRQKTTKPDSDGNATDKSQSNVKKTKGEKRERRERKAEKPKKEKHDSESKGTTEVGDKGDNKLSRGAVKTAAAKATTAAPVLPMAPKLTPLQASMRQKLISARFRHLNETLYTRPSEEAFDLFQESPEMFEEYHEGFRQQVKVWPENPVSSFLKDVRERAKARPPGKGKPGAQPVIPLSRTPLPRTSGTCTIADLGCGDAQLSQSLDDEKRKLRVQIKSFDLQAPNPFITKADIANLPLPDGSVDVAVFCLALMGTNWVDFIEEAYRILHWKGELWIAEIKSRFGPVRGSKSRVSHSVGARTKKTAPKKGKAATQSSGLHEDDLAVEVDGADDTRGETDVTSFVDVLRKRGFVLQGEKRDAIDLSNKMFVKMHFVKAASPSKGKGADAPAASKGDRRLTFEQHAKVNAAEDDADLDEASILKPCVYKIR